MTRDNYGTDLECNVVCEEPPLYRLSIPLDQDVNLDAVLPLTSTPVQYRFQPKSEPRTRPRISAPRRKLPEEREKEELSFLSRLNPFRKKR